MRASSPEPDSNEPMSVWPRRLAWLLCCLTFLLIGVGGLITTTDAGMAVPDWPGTYGENMFLYSWSKWLFGGWDIRVEHGHRLLASLVGFVTIGLVCVVWLNRTPRMLWLALLALGLVIFQGVLGGMRVIANERLIGLAHGVTGPLFFALTCVIVARLVTLRRGAAGSLRLGIIAFATAAAAFAQIGLGAALRHMPEAASPWAFATVVKFHLFGAAVVAVLALLLSGWSLAFRGARLAGLAVGLVVLLQLSAGLGTWVLKYGLPGWAEGLASANMGANVAGGLWQTYIVTAHQAGGSLLLGIATFLATRALTKPPEQATPIAPAFE